MIHVDDRPDKICQNACRRMNFNPNLIGPSASSRNPIVDENIAKQINVIIKRRINIERVSTQPINSRKIQMKELPFHFHSCPQNDIPM